LAHGSHFTIQACPVAGVYKPEVTIVDASDGRLSYDGHWLAYYGETDDQLYVTSFPHPGRASPSPRADTTRAGARMDRNSITLARIGLSWPRRVRETAQDLTVTSSYPLFRLTLPENVGFYDVTPDGQRFLINTRPHLEQPALLTVITDWRAQFRVESSGQHPKS
jgi:hypothetical protein